ncbi:MAG TPA: hypothetical protein VJ850_13050 [Candidatus Limnocylindrales bacterium]|nr:hypothetical protein [Candidatus Limnocylindrales bacterium]
MENVSVVLLIVAAVASRPIEARLWRSGRLSDRAAAILVLGRFPVLAFVFGLVSGASPLLVLALSALTLLPPLVFYRTFVDLLRQQRTT